MLKKLLPISKVATEILGIDASNRIRTLKILRELKVPVVKIDGKIKVDPDDVYEGINNNKFLLSKENWIA